ncbi:MULTISPECIES: CYTH domain-containing protein [Cyanophyceae]|uniref:CYTH domain-containing protein n=1 Tax=Cyanophyceae TaxID=3028117 RepID=UPI00232E14AC|nr:MULTISPECIES: CYTH domain-containing protein [Cyanophyceae]MDB9357965.1 CYTH domain-containing protein [Nodularia spumigena CS-587/03]MDB9304074.1 CYTH domain-containing protein [Nodularia spumigena CS-591/12]MDB9320118.1 CYTH domain-containing protein [Nodularia spumigena CS-590/01A]MDB9321077.1 CYTH domain-containing protein [Nodularia spumigena CS-591/07A]MDB9325224.1 CYTH domain-containing protein [Nodularia spumigena CS-590/02]
MAQEIERKYLLKEDSWRKIAQGSVYCQGYIATKDKVTVRVRIVGQQGYLTIKGPSVECSRLEFEYPIPVEDAQEMLNTLCQKPFIEKIRYKVEWGGLIWEIDEFDGLNKGLILAEVELSDANQQISLPPWIGEEVSHDPRYFNSYLVTNPFSKW